jgi:hypothetical protein
MSCRRSCSVAYCASGGRLPPGVPASGPVLYVREDELVGRWGDASSGPDLVVGLSEGAADDLIGQLFAADGRELLECHEEAPPAGSIERLAADSTRAFHLRLRRTDGGGPLRGYALVVDKQGLRWRVCLTLDDRARTGALDSKTTASRAWPSRGSI